VGDGVGERPPNSAVAPSIAGLAGAPWVSSRVDLGRREAKVIGKGNKERVVFFTERSLEWLTRYLSRRHDDEISLFVKQLNPPDRLTYAAVKTAFQRLGPKAGLDK
jgi:integrase/recombinase XerD